MLCESGSLHTVTDLGLMSGEERRFVRDCEWGHTRARCNSLQKDALIAEVAWLDRGATPKPIGLKVSHLSFGDL